MKIFKLICKYFKLLKAYKFVRKKKKAENIFFDYYGWQKSKNYHVPIFIKKLGFQSKISEFYNMHGGRKIFILANGPSLKNVNLSILKNEIVIGCNGIYKLIDKYDLEIDYFFCEDEVQLELRASDLKKIKSKYKMTAIYNAHLVKDFKNWIFYNVPRCLGEKHNRYYWNELYPQFSKDFASIVHQGNTITYMMLQFAYFLGAKEVYILGLDYNYGKLNEYFKPGKIKVTKENFDLIKECHFDQNYYKIGDYMGVPHLDDQKKAFQLARKIFYDDGRTIINMNENSGLDTFEKKNINELNSIIQ